MTPQTHRETRGTRHVRPAGAAPKGPRRGRKGPPNDRHRSSPVLSPFAPRKGLHGDPRLRYIRRNEPPAAVAAAQAAETTALARRPRSQQAVPGLLPLTVTSTQVIDEDVSSPSGPAVPLRDPYSVIARWDLVQPTRHAIEGVAVRRRHLPRQTDQRPSMRGRHRGSGRSDDDRHNTESTDEATKRRAAHGNVRSAR